MNMIKGFENEDIIVSDFGEWVGKDYIDYKAEYKRNQKFIEILLDENKQLKDKWDKLKKFVLKKQAILFDAEYICYSNVLDKMQELEQGSDSNE